MPIYFRSKQVKDLDFLRYNGKSYKRTGKHLPKNSTTTTHLSDCDPFYVTSCSATDFGNQIIIPGGTVTVPYSATEFQLKFTGCDVGSQGHLILEDEQGRTCSIQLSVDSLSALVFDVGETGVPSPHTFDKISYPSTINYVDCMSHKWDVKYAAPECYYLTFFYQGQSIFKCGSAPIDLDAIYKVGSDNRTGLGGQINANTDSTTSAGYSLPYKTLNYGVDTAAGATGMPIILQDLVEAGEDVTIYMKGTGGNGAVWESATGENLSTHEWGLSTTAGGFSNGTSWDKLTFPTGTYSTSATIMHGNSARICFAGTTPTTPAGFGDKYFTVLKELIDVKSVPVGGNTDIEVEFDGETFIKFEGTTPGQTATATMSSPVGMTCSVMLSVNAGGDLVFDATSVGNGPLVYTTFPQSQEFTDCHGDVYDVVMTGLGSFNISMQNMRPFIYASTGTYLDNRPVGDKPAWVHYNVIGTDGGAYQMAKEYWTDLKTPSVREPVAMLIENNPTIEMNVGDGLTLATANLSSAGGSATNTLSAMDNHPIWIKTVRSPGVPQIGETPPGVLIGNGTPDQGSTYRYVRFRPLTSGTYYYNCEHHASMSGEIIVNDVIWGPTPPVTPTPTADSNPQPTPTPTADSSNQPTPTPTPTPSPTCNGPGHTEPFPSPYPNGQYLTTDFVPTIMFAHTPGTSAVSVSANWSEFYQPGVDNMDLNSWDLSAGRRINLQPGLSASGKPSGYKVINGSSEDLIFKDGGGTVQFTVAGGTSAYFDPDLHNTYDPSKCHQDGYAIDWTYVWSHWPSHHYGYVLMFPYPPEHPSWPTTGNSR